MLSVPTIEVETGVLLSMERGFEAIPTEMMQCMPAITSSQPMMG
jgi:hypothetical protein